MTSIWALVPLFISLNAIDPGNGAALADDPATIFPATLVLGPDQTLMFRSPLDTLLLQAGDRATFECSWNGLLLNGHRIRPEPNAGVRPLKLNEYRALYHNVPFIVQRLRPDSISAGIPEWQEAVGIWQSRIDSLHATLPLIYAVARDTSSTARALQVCCKILTDTDLFDEVRPTSKPIPIPGGENNIEARRRGRPANELFVLEPRPLEEPLVGPTSLCRQGVELFRAVEHALSTRHAVRIDLTGGVSIAPPLPPRNR
jgi:hypothetical protein